MTESKPEAPVTPAPEPINPPPFKPSGGMRVAEEKCQPKKRDEPK